MVGEDLAHQRRVWRFQRAGWAGMALLVALALSGALGNGVLAEAEASAGPDGPMVRYERVQRTGREARIVVSVPRAAEGGTVLRLSGTLVEREDLITVAPAQAVVARSVDGMVLRLSPGADGEAAVVMRMRAREAGLLRARLGAASSRGEAGDVSFRVLVLP